jgi:hypothetical protein
MKNMQFLVAVLVSLFLVATVLGENSKPTISIDSAKQTASSTATEDTSEIASKKELSIIGTWAIEPNKHILEGELTFQTDGKYSKTEKGTDSSSATIKGEYEFDNSEQPITLDLCFGKCGGPGSEWTTRFGIMRFLSADKIEIRHSPTDKRPTEFTKERDEYTLILTRKAVSEKKK